VKTEVSFCNLKHNEHSCRAIGYGVAQVAAYAIKHLGDRIGAKLYQFPSDFSSYLEGTTPKIACFSNFIWNSCLSNEYAIRVKKKYPGTIIVFGGPQYPLDPKEQEAYLRSHPAIDFYIFREGEQAFVELFNRLSEYQFSVKDFKSAGIKSPNCHYLFEDNLVRGDLLTPLKDLDEIPSPYLTGLCDDLLDKGLIPIIQTKKGCPFKCTFCEDGDDHFNRTRRFSFDRIKRELEYIAKRNCAPTLMLADLNFGMYKDDIDVCREIAKNQEKHGWPKYFQGIAGKNKKDQVLEAASIVKGSFLSAAVQTSNPEVLKNIKRDNVSHEQMVQVSHEAEANGANSFSELIVGLPGETKGNHTQSVLELIDAEISVVRSHQFMMLPGAEASNQYTREKFGLRTGFRVTPATFDDYHLFGESFFAPEITEICVGSSSMSFEDYLECRMLDLTVEIFYNNGLFREIYKFLKLCGVQASSIILKIQERMCEPDSPLASVYEGFVRETRELFDTWEKTAAFVRQTGMIQQYRSGKLGNNEQLVYRALPVFNHMSELHNVIFDVSREALGGEGNIDAQKEGYLGELLEFSLLRKKDLFSTHLTERKMFHYDFVGLNKSNFNSDPLPFYASGGFNLEISHTLEQKEHMSKALKIHGTSKNGLATILSSGTQFNAFFREFRAV